MAKGLNLLDYEEEAGFEKFKKTVGLAKQDTKLNKKNQTKKRNQQRKVKDIESGKTTEPSES